MYETQEAPVKVGDEVDVSVESVGEQGDGMARVRGFVLFVPGTKKGDNVKVKITKVLKRVGFAEVIGKAEPRAEKVRPALVEMTPVEEVIPPSADDSEDFGEDLGHETVESFEDELKKKGQ